MKDESQINIFYQIKAFYSIVFNGDFELKPTHISLYMFLLNQNNRNNWVEWFKCPFDLAMQGASIGSKNTYYKCLSELQTFGFINYEKGINNYKAPKIKIINLSTISKNGILTEPLCEPLPIPLSEQVIVPLSDNIIRLITNNYKTLNNRYKEFSDFLESFKNEDEKRYTEKEFIERWKAARLHYDKQPLNFTKLEPFELVNFNNIIKTYNKDQIDQAIGGLFSQETYKSTRLRPTHFLELKHFEKYLTCWQTNEVLFPKNQKPVERL